MAKADPALTHLARPGTEIAVRVTPRAAANAIETGAEGLHIRVTAVPEDGRANRAVTKLLAGALGVAPSRLTLIRGIQARDKVFRVD